MLHLHYPIIALDQDPPWVFDSEDELTRCSPSDRRDGWRLLDFDGRYAVVENVKVLGWADPWNLRSFLLRERCRRLELEVADGGILSLDEAKTLLREAMKRSNLGRRGSGMLKAALGIIERGRHIAEIIRKYKVVVLGT